MKASSSRSLAGVLLVMGLVLLPCVSHGSEPLAFSDPDKWRIELTPLLWVAGVDGTAETRAGGDASTSSDFEDVVANLEFGFMMHAEVGKGQWAVLFDGIFIDIGTEGSGPLGGDVDGNVRLSMADVGFAWRFFNVPLSDGELTPRVMVEGIAGVRYIGLKVELDPVLLASRTRSADLIDPYVGGRVTLAVNRRLVLVAKGSIGGFGVGADLDWTAGLYAEYNLATWCAVAAGYHAMGLNLEDGGRFDGLDFDAVFHGPLVGITFRL